MRKIGTLHMDGKYFNDEASETMGAPGLTPEILSNRRKVTGQLTKEGKEWKKFVIDWFKCEYGVDVKLSWSIYAGCSMCPCSPGFVIRIDNDKVIGPRTYKSWSTISKRLVTNDNKFLLWVENDKFDPCLPNIPLLKKVEVQA